MTSTAATLRVASPAPRLYRMHEATTPVQQLADAELVARVRNGDASACDALVRRHYRSLFAVAMAILGNHADAEDCCHDGLVRALERLEDCAQPDRFVHWAIAIVRNLSRNRVAHVSVRHASDLDPHTPSTDAPVTRRLEVTELRGRLEHALSALTPVQREVVLLHDLNDWPHETIAESIGTSAGMSRQHLFKARRRLREILGPRILKEYFDG